MTDSNHLDPLRLNFRRLGAVLTIVSAALTGLFGLTQSSSLFLAGLIAVGLMGAAVASAYVWPFVAASIRDKGYASAGLLVVFGVLVTSTDVTTNFGSLAWQRGGNIDEAKVSEVRYDDSRAKVADNEASIARWKDHLQKLETENAWLPTVTADALRANLAAADEAIRQEAARGGCGPKCLDLTKQKADLEARIALAEQKADLSSKIEATQRKIDQYRSESATVEKVESGAHRQNVALASVFTISLDPSEEAQHWTDKGITWLVALFFTFGAMGCNYIGWGIPAAVREAVRKATSSDEPIGDTTGLASQLLPRRETSTTNTTSTVIHDDRKALEAIIGAWDRRLPAAGAA